MRLESIRVQHPNPLIEKYFYDFPAVEKYFTYNPYRREEFSRRYRYLQENWPFGNQEGNHRQVHSRRQLVQVLTAYNQSLGCSEATLDNLEKLSREASACIITGQQAGVLTGPLYTIYKIITAIQLASKLSEDLAAPIVPVFWVASEDHDFEEINHLNLLSKENQLVKLKLDRELDGKHSIGDLPVADDVENLIEELASLTIDTEFKETILADFRSLAREAKSLAHWFALLINKLFSRYGLIIIDPMEPGLRQLAKEPFKSFIKQNHRINQALQQGAEELSQGGYSPPVARGNQQTNLFVYDGEGHGERLPLLSDDEKFFPKGKHNISWSRDEILAKIEADPAGFSPNVVLRPITQDFLLPNLAYIGGPGEIAYYAQFKEIYPVLGLEMPMLYPRVTVTLVEKYLKGYLDKYNLSFTEIMMGQLKAREEEFLAAAGQVNLEELFGGMRETLHDLYKKTIEELTVIDANLKNIGSENYKRVLYQVEQLEGKARQYHRKNYAEVLRQFDKIGVNLLPEGKWQERRFNIVPYLIKYGPELIHELVQLPLIEDYNHKLIFWGDGN